METKEPAIAYGNRKFTVEEYLQTERASEQKHEYLQGKYLSWRAPVIDTILYFTGGYIQGSDNCTW